jgi:hypothetical protein
MESCFGGICARQNACQRSTQPARAWRRGLGRGTGPLQDLYVAHPDGLAEDSDVQVDELIVVPGGCPCAGVGRVFGQGNLFLNEARFATAEWQLFLREPELAQPAGSGGHARSDASRMCPWWRGRRGALGVLSGKLLLRY